MKILITYKLILVINADIFTLLLAATVSLPAPCLAVWGGERESQVGFGEHGDTNSWSGELEGSHQLCPLIPLQQGSGKASGCPCLEFLEQGKVLCSPVVSRVPGAGKVFISSSWEFLEQGRVLLPPLFSRRAPLHSSLLPLSFGLNRALCTIWIMLTIAYLEPVFSPLSLLPSLPPSFFQPIFPS